MTARVEMFFYSGGGRDVGVCGSGGWYVVCLSGYRVLPAHASPVRSSSRAVSQEVLLSLTLRITLPPHPPPSQHLISAHYNEKAELYSPLTYCGSVFISLIKI